MLNHPLLVLLLDLLSQLHGSLLLTPAIRCAARPCCSTGFKDELAFAAAMLYKATGGLFEPAGRAV